MFFTDDYIPDLSFYTAKWLHRGLSLSKTIPTTIAKIPGRKHLTFVTFRAGGPSCLFRFPGSRDKISNRLRATFR
jgi:hypothetical protein